MAESYKQGLLSTNVENKLMESIKNLLKRYKDPLSTGVAAVVVGFAARKAMKMDNISTGSLKSALGSFVLVSAAGIVAQEANAKMM